MPEYVMLAKKFDENKHNIGGWMLSEKLDGQRAFWDGGISRGKVKATIPYANVARDERYKEQQIATGLWSRYGNVIHAPDWWLDNLPKGICLDGELHGSMSREDLFSVTSSFDKSRDMWVRVVYNVFDIPHYSTFLAYRRINNPNQSMVVNGAGDLVVPTHEIVLNMEQATFLLDKNYRNDVVHPLPQVRLPDKESEAVKRVQEELQRVMDAGGEGVMLRSPYSIWSTERSNRLLKVKKLDDHEGVVIGYTSGAETDKGSKLRGMLGALVLRTVGPKGPVVFELSGFTDAERRLENEASDWAWHNPGKRFEDEWFFETKNLISKVFPLDTQVSFQHRGWTRDGIPMEARYFRR